MVKCPEFLTFAPIARLAVIKDKGLCPVCFRRGYKCIGAKGNPGECAMKRLFCTECKEAYNTMLHTGKNLKLNLSVDMNISKGINNACLIDENLYVNNLTVFETVSMFTK